MISLWKYTTYNLALVRTGYFWGVSVQGNAEVVLSFRQKNKYIVPSAAAGFTLMELVVTIAVVAILAAVGMPAMSSFISQNRLSGNVNEFIAANMLARSEAIKRGGGVTICRSVNADTATTTACDTSDSDWKTGWLVVVVNTADSTKNEVLARQGALTAGTTVTPDPTATTTTSIIYNALGAPTQAPPSKFGFAFKGTPARSVCFDPSGRAQAC